MDRNGWAMNTPWTAEGGNVYDKDGGRVATCHGSYGQGQEAEAQARAEFIVAAVNACHEAGGTQVEFAGAHAYESEECGTYCTHGLENPLDAEYHAKQFQDGRVFRLFRFKDAGMKPRS